MSKKNVLHVVYGLMSGGVEQMLLNYFSTDEFDDYNFYIAYMGSADERCLNAFLNIGFKPIKLSHRTNERISFYNEIKNIIKEFNINIVHSSLNIENYLVMKAAFDSGVQLRISHSHGLPDPSSNFIKKQLRKIKLLIGRKYSNCNLACSTKAGDYLFGVGKYDVIYNAMDIYKFKFNREVRKSIRSSLNISDNELLIGYVGRLANGKNHKFLIDLFSSMNIKEKNIKVIFIGAGPLKNEIINYINIKKLEDSVNVLDSKSNIQDYYNAMDLFVFPSAEEGLGMVAIEAQLNNLPCICSLGVPIDTKISDDIYYIDLNMNLWDSAILDILKNRNDLPEKFNYNENYDISVQRKKVHDLYERLNNCE